MHSCKNAKRSIVWTHCSQNCKSINRSFSVIQRNVSNCWRKRSPNWDTAVTTFMQKWHKRTETGCSMISVRVYAEILSAPIYLPVVLTYRLWMLLSTLIFQKWLKLTCIGLVDQDVLDTWVSKFWLLNWFIEEKFNLLRGKIQSFARKSSIFCLSHVHWVNSTNLMYFKLENSRYCHQSNHLWRSFQSSSHRKGIGYGN